MTQQTYTAPFPGHLEWRVSQATGSDTALADGLFGAEVADTLPTGARDHHLAEVFVQLYGPRVEATRRCAGCGESYDIDFDLTQLLDALSGASRPEAVSEVLADGRVRLHTGHVLRAPTRADEQAVAGLTVNEAAEALFARCCDATGATGPLEMAEAEAALDWLSPLVDVDLTGSCPECGVEEVLRFSIEAYLARSLAQERDRLLRETHLMAAAYHWSFDSILALDRRDRRRLAGLVEDDRFAVRTGGWG